MSKGLVVSLLVGSAGALRAPMAIHGHRRSVGVRMDFGDSFYAGFAKWAAEYPEEDKVRIRTSLSVHSRERPSCIPPLGRV